MSFVDDPRAFLEGHAVLISEQIADPGTGGVRWFRITPLVAGGSTYVIGGDEGDGERFPAYWVPYRANKYSEYDLATAADYSADVRIVLTFTLSGCTFVAGDGPRPKLAHINYQEGSEIDQARIDHKLAKHFGDGGARMVLKKDGYLGRAAGIGNNKYTVVGVREGAEWIFFLNTKGRFSNGQKAWQLHGMVDIPDANAAAAGGAGGGRGSCTIL